MRIFVRFIDINSFIDLYIGQNLFLTKAGLDAWQQKWVHSGAQVYRNKTPEDKVKLTILYDFNCNVKLFY